jgi:hypothetical protein
MGSNHHSFISPTIRIAHARLKSDKVDAVMFARLLKADFLPTVWIPGETERYVKELLAQLGSEKEAKKGTF